MQKIHDDPESARSTNRRVLSGSGSDRTVLAAIARRAMIERGLDPDFPPSTDQELAEIGAPVVTADGMRDLCDRLWVSIDNDDSRDLDQLTLAEPLATGQVRILVAVADVDALVHKGSVIDGHASHNTTSVYTPAAIFPMLPEALSTDLTSLNENQDRAAIVADMVFESNGSLSSSDFYRARVRNQARLTYRSVVAGRGRRGAPRPLCDSWLGREPPSAGRRGAAPRRRSTSPRRAEPRDVRADGESFDAIVTGASQKGTWVRLVRPPIEGRLEQGFQGLDVGDHVRVRLTGTDVERGFIDFARG